MDLKSVVSIINDKLDKNSGVKAIYQSGFFDDKILIANGKYDIVITYFWGAYNFEMTQRELGKKVITGSVKVELGYGIEDLVSMINLFVNQSDNTGWVFVRLDNGKHSLDYSTPAAAKKVYDQIVKTGKIKYAEIAAHDEFEISSLEKLKSGEYTEEDMDIYSPDDEFKVWVVRYGNSNGEIESTNFDED